MCWCEAHYFRARYGLPSRSDSIVPPLVSPKIRRRKAKTILFFCNTILTFAKSWTIWACQWKILIPWCQGMGKPHHAPSHPNTRLEFETLVIYDFLGHTKWYLALLHDSFAWLFYMILSSFGPTFFKPFFEKPSQYSSTKVNFNWKKLFVEKNGSNAPIQFNWWFFFGKDALSSVNCDTIVIFTMVAPHKCIFLDLGWSSK